MIWLPYTLKNEVVGINITGDNTVPKTKWWNAFFLRLFIWREVSILEPYNPTLEDQGVRSWRSTAKDAIGYYYVGYTDNTTGKTYLYQTVIAADSFVAVLRAHENRTYFALSMDDERREIPLRFSRRIKKDNPSLRYTRVF